MSLSAKGQLTNTVSTRWDRHAPAVAGRGPRLPPSHWGHPRGLGHGGSTPPTPRSLKAERPAAWGLRGSPMGTGCGQRSIRTSPRLAVLQARCGRPRPPCHLGARLLGAGRGTAGRRGSALNRARLSAPGAGLREPVLAMLLAFGGQGEACKREGGWLETGGAQAGLTALPPWEPRARALRMAPGSCLVASSSASLCRNAAGPARGPGTHLLTGP